MFVQFKLGKAVNQSRDIFDKYFYKSDDAIATVSAVGYFAGSRYAIDPGWVGSIIECQCLDGYIIGSILANGGVNILLGSGAPTPESGVSWQGVWEDKTYLEGDQVRDGGWLMIANKTTEERAAPQENRPSTFDLPIAPSWVQSMEPSMLLAGHQYTFSQSGWLRTVQSWTYVESFSPPYRAIIVDVTNPLIPITRPLPVFTGGSDQWQNLQLSNIVVAAGTVLHIILVSLSSGGSSTWDAPYNYIDQNVQIPSAGQWSRDSQHTRLRISKTASDASDQTANLAAMILGSEFAIDNASMNGRFSYIVLGSVDNGTWIEFSVGVTSVEGSFNPGDPTVVGGIFPLSPQADYVAIENQWSGTSNDPEWGTVQGVVISEDGSPVVDDNAYGIRVEFQPAVISSDWDFLSLAD